MYVTEALRIITKNTVIHEKCECLDVHYYDYIKPNKAPIEDKKPEKTPEQVKNHILNKLRRG